MSDPRPCCGDGDDLNWLAKMADAQSCVVCSAVCREAYVPPAAQPATVDIDPWGRCLGPLGPDILRRLREGELDA